MFRGSKSSTPKPNGVARSLGVVMAAALVALSLTLDAAGASAAPATPGASSAGDSLFTGIGNGGYDVSHYGVDLTYASDGSIAAVATIDATATQPLSSFSLDFEGLTVDSVTVNGDPATFTRESDAAQSKYKLVVTPQAAISGDFTTVVSYSGTPEAHVDPDGSSEGWVATSDGATAVGQPVGTMTWLPSNNTPRDKATFDVVLTVPTTIGGLSAAGVSNGILRSTTPHPDGTTTWAWSQPNQQATELALVSIGQYREFRSTITLAGGRTISEWSFVDPTTAPAAQTEITALRSRLPEILAYLETKYGPYPGASTGVVVDNTDLGYALETQDRPFFEGSIDEDTLIHELTHQWFGDAVTPADWNDIWLNEGPATYTPTEYIEDHSSDPADSAEKVWFGLWADTPANASEWATPPAAMTAPDELFGWQVYNRGAMTLAALRAAVTTPVFDDIMRQWTTEKSGTSVRTADFIALAEKVSGRDLGAFFQEWLYSAAKPAWPATWSLHLETPDSPATPVAPGTSLTYSMTAKNTGTVPLEGASVSADLAGILKVSTLDAATLPAGLSLDGDSLTWRVPTTAVGRTATTTFTVRIAQDPAADRATVTLRAASLGATCAGCGVFHTFASSAVDPGVGGGEPASAGDEPVALAATGSSTAGSLGFAGGLLLLGAMLITAGRRRSRRIAASARR